MSRTFVLVHGAFHGGWCWCFVNAILTAKGHRVYSPTLKGLAERSHLSEEINLDTHIAEVVDLFKSENIENAVLCGHSYSGWVISGVVEQVESKVSSLVFIDAYVPQNGQCGLDLSMHKDDIEEAVKNGKITRPSPGAAYFRVNEKDRAWVDAKMTPQPIGVSRQRIHLTGARERIPRKTYIRAAGFPSPEFDQYLVETNSKGWSTFELPCGHDVMIDLPEPLSKILCEVA